MGLDTEISIRLKKGRSGICTTTEICYWRKCYTIAKELLKVCIEEKLVNDEYDYDYFDCCLTNQALEKIISKLEEIYDEKFWKSLKNSSIWNSDMDMLEHFKEELETLKLYKGKLTDNFDYELWLWSWG